MKKSLPERVRCVSSFPLYSYSSESLTTHKMLGLRNDA